MVFRGESCVGAQCHVFTVFFCIIMFTSPTDAYIFAVSYFNVFDFLKQYYRFLYIIITITATMPLGENLVSFIYFALKTVQQCNIHVIWGPTCIVWCWTSKGWANGKMWLHYNYLELYWEHNEVNMINCFTISFFLCVKGSVGCHQSTRWLHPNSPPSYIVTNVWHKRHQVHCSDQTLQLQFWFKGE